MPDQVAQHVGLHQGQWKHLSRTCSSSRSKCTDLSPKVKVSSARLAARPAARHGIHRRAQPLAAAQQAADAGDQNGQFEGFGEVVVGAGGEAAQHIVRMAARRQHQGGHELPGLAQSRTSPRSRLCRAASRPEPPRRRAAMRALQQLQRRFARVHHLHLIAFRLQVEAQALRPGAARLPLPESGSFQLPEVAEQRCSRVPAPRFRPRRGRRAAWPPSARCTGPSPVPLTRVASGPGTR